MGLSESAMSTSSLRPVVNGFASIRRACAMALVRTAYGLFYAILLGLVIGVPAGVAYLVWHWLTH